MQVLVWMVELYHDHLSSTTNSRHLAPWEWADLSCKERWVSYLLSYALFLLSYAHTYDICMLAYLHVWYIQERTREWRGIYKYHVVGRCFLSCGNSNPLVVSYITIVPQRRIVSFWTCPMSLMGKRGNEAEEGCGKSLLLFVSSGFFSPYHIKKNITIKEYQIKSVYKYFFDRWVLIRETNLMSLSNTWFATVILQWPSANYGLIYLIRFVS